MALRRKSNFRPALSLLLAAALVGIWTDVSAAAPGHANLPRISDIRIGISNCYKVGHWTPVWVDVEGGDGLAAAHVEVTVADSDGVETVASASLRSPTSPHLPHTAVAYTKVGRVGAPVRIALVNDRGLLDKQTLRYIAESKAGSPLVELPATGELVVALSAVPLGLEEAFASRDAGGSEFPQRTIWLKRVADLPGDWFGYDAVDVLVISAGEGALCRELVADTARYAALVRWIELGGRLVVLCGGEAAHELLADGGALAGLAPGKFQDTVRLNETGSLEHFAEPATAIVRPGGGAISVPRLVEVQGKIEVYAGRRPTDLPLVIRAARGLGEIAFAGVDVTTPPLADWSGRATLLQALLRPYTAGAQNEAPQTLVTLGYDDLSGALRQRLGQSFSSVKPIGFSTVAALAIAYLLVLGPLDYLLVHRWLRRPLAAWITFPTIVILFGFAGLTLAEWRKGTGGVRVNRLELVDFDATTGNVRGTFWSTLYSPQAQQLDLSARLDVVVREAAPQGTELLLSWWGLPGAGIGGMRAGGSNLGIVRDAYRYSADRSALQDVPVLASATKSLVAQWVRSGSALVEAQLSDVDGFATGSLVNQTGRTLRNVRLLYGSWGYRLGDLSPGQRMDVGEHLDPLSVKTIVTRSALGGSGAGVERDRVFVPERASAVELLNAMMFYEAAGGERFAQLPHRYQSYCDLSRHLALGRAVLVAEADVPGSRLVDGASQETVGGASEFAAVVVRVVIPVEKEREAL